MTVPSFSGIRAHHLFPLACILLLAFLIRVPGLNDPVYGDEAHVMRLVGSGDLGKIIAGDESGHPPFYIWANATAALFLGPQDWVFRLTSVVFGLGSIVLLYFIVHRLFDRRTALLAAGLLALSAWFVIGSLQIHLDAPFLMFWYLLAFYAFLKYDMTARRRWLVLAGCAFGLGLLTKISAPLLLVPIVAYAWSRGRLKRHVPSYVVIAVVGGAFLGAFVFGIAPLTGAAHPFSVGALSDVYLAPKQTFMTQLINSAVPLVFFTPLLLGLLVVAAGRWKERPLWLFWIWIIAHVAFYYFVLQTDAKSLERWLTIILPAAAVLGAVVLRAVPWQRRIVSVTTGASLVFALVFFVMNAGYHDILPFYPKSEFVSRAVHGPWNFYVPLTGNAGPIGFYLGFDVIALGFAAGILLALAAVVSMRIQPKATIPLLILFIGCGAGFTILVAGEHLFHASSPDIEEATHVLLRAYQTTASGPLAIFGRVASIEFYEPRRNFTFLDFPNETSLAPRGTVLVFNFPQINPESVLWKSFQTCESLSRYENKGAVLALVLRC